MISWPTPRRRVRAASQARVPRTAARTAAEISHGTISPTVPGYAGPGRPGRYPAPSIDIVWSADLVFAGQPRVLSGSRSIMIGLQGSLRGRRWRAGLLVGAVATLVAGLGVATATSAN